MFKQKLKLKLSKKFNKRKERKKRKMNKIELMGPRSKRVNNKISK